MHIIARLARADLNVVHALWLVCVFDLLDIRFFALSLGFFPRLLSILDFLLSLPFSTYAVSDPY